MKKAVEALYGLIPSYELPSSSYVSMKLEELENNEPTASPMDEITSATDVDLAIVTANLDLSGKIQVLRKKSKSSLPTNPEQFRLRLRVEKNLWLFMQAKFGPKSWLQGLEPKHFEAWTDYFLGRRVMLLEVHDADGNKKSLDPPWQIILAYELECRKNAFANVNENGTSLADSMTAAMQNSELKELCFTCPLAVSFASGTKRAKQTPGEWGSAKWRKTGEAKEPSKTKGKGKGGKGKGGKGAKGKNTGLLFNSPDGKPICFAYNAGNCTDPSCTRLHVCRKKGCLATHTLKDNHPEFAWMFAGH